MVYLGKSVEKEMYFGARPELFRLALKMRKKPTEAEATLWKHLKKLRHEGYIFRRQHPIDFYIADFYCHKIKLIIEVDGEIHNNSVVIEHDMGRAGELERFGITIIRFSNNQIFNNIDLVIKQINKSIDELTTPALPG